MHLLGLRAFLKTEMIDFPTLSYTSAIKSTLFYTAKALIRYSFWAEPPV